MSSQSSTEGGREIFISYRREDSESNTGRIFDHLTENFSPETIFKDVDNMPMGVDFRKHLDQQLTGCRGLLAVIGRQWAENPRLMDEADFVRNEIEHGLDPERDILVVPVLVGNASMPSTDQLPPSLKDFAYRNAIPVRPDPDFHKDMDKLIKNLEDLLDIPLADEQPAVVKAAEGGDAEAQFNLEFILDRI